MSAPHWWAEFEPGDRDASRDLPASLPYFGKRIYSTGLRDDLLSSVAEADPDRWFFDLGIHLESCILCRTLSYDSADVLAQLSLIESCPSFPRMSDN